MTGYFSTSPLYQVNKIPGEAIKMEALGRTLVSESTKAPPCLEVINESPLLHFSRGNTESFMK